MAQCPTAWSARALRARGVEGGLTLLGNTTVEEGELDGERWKVQWLGGGGEPQMGSSRVWKRWAEDSKLGRI